MKAKEVRHKYLEFFESKQHKIVSSAPMVVKNDPTLMFINAGMNQFKDIFLGNGKSPNNRVADTQKCLRVSGKHNDLDEVGHDTYHHTMFEMLGNWSFGDYFKKEAIAWAWELLTEVYGLKADNLYVTVFEGDKEDGTIFDQEAFDFWKAIIPEERILNGNKKDNFWEMGESGPCGPCSEIHIDIRSDKEKAKISGRELINMDHPEVIEIWNLVFIEFNRKANGQLESLPEKHIDTGMGFERLTMAIQGVRSNYDTDIFQPIIQTIAKETGFVYGKNKKQDIAMRVVADHIRALAFTIADGQLPSNVGAGYVIRRILRRAVRYAYSFLDKKEAFIYKLLPILIQEMGDAFPELIKQEKLILKVIQEEENSFLNTLSTGIQRIEKIIEQLTLSNKTSLSGKDAFELYDTFGFPFDLTELIVKENGLSVSKADFDKYMLKQKDRSKKASVTETDDWVIVSNKQTEKFVGYESLSAEINILRYRKIVTKNSIAYQLVFDQTPFYAESGGQVGDTGFIQNDTEKINIFDTKKENNLTIHFTKQLPKNPEKIFQAQVIAGKRWRTANNHTAAHLMHHALRKVLGAHVEQKGSYVDADYLRFDFAHFQKMTDEEISLVEKHVNQAIWDNASANIQDDVDFKTAEERGAIALFGEKYGDKVRVVQFADSVELCGGTHVEATGQIGLFKILHEGAIAAGIRRIEAITGEKAIAYYNTQASELEQIKEILKGQKDLSKGVKNLLDENKKLQKQINELNQVKATGIKNELLSKAIDINGIKIIASTVDLDADNIKKLVFAILRETKQTLVAIGGKGNNKVSLTIALTNDLIEEKGLDAGKLIRSVSKEIQGGGGGQAHFATAGGKNPDGLEKAYQLIKELIKN
ncbi:MAG: alanine--tRNA ligase [Bacteroidales bacterium]|jgi:alanyl-tRNA synthetase|nr:alanine--tRNA ligase [Bacteroidales bacterium]